MKVWVRIAVDLVKEENPSESEPPDFGAHLQYFWVSVKMPHPPSIGLQLEGVSGVPFLSIPPVTQVFFVCDKCYYSCHTEPFVYGDVAGYERCVHTMKDRFGDNFPE